VLLVVAQRETVVDHIEVVRRAGLRVRAVDSSPLALLRALPAPPGGGLEAVVSVGADLIVVAVREGLVPRFVRTVGRPTAAVTVPAEDEASVGASAGYARRRPEERGAGSRLDPMVEEVRGSLEYFHSHSQEEEGLEGVVLTGGGALEDRVAERLGSAIGVPVRAGEIDLDYEPKVLGLNRSQLDQARMRWVAVAGLALWGRGELRAPSLVPEEVRQRERFRQALVVSGAGLVVVAAGLGVVSHGKAAAAERMARTVRSEDAEAASLQARISGMRSVTAVQADLATRRGLAQAALNGDIDWVSLVGRVEKALPRGVVIRTVSLSRAAANATGSAGPGGAISNEDVGQISMSLSASGGASLVAQFVRAMWNVSGVYALWVSGANTTNGGGGQVTTFSATAQVTSAAFSKRANKLPGGQK
jgi:hypothetical protein